MWLEVFEWNPLKNTFLKIPKSQKIVILENYSFDLDSATDKMIEKAFYNSADNTFTFYWKPFSILFKVDLKTNTSSFKNLSPNIFENMDIQYFFTYLGEFYIVGA